jgi:hypothetical protein
MAQRRDRPPVQRSGESLNIRLPDGRTMSVPLSTSRGPSTADVCCFCGRSVEHSDNEYVRIGVRWIAEGGDERQQSWGAHHACLLERMHEGVKGHGPFFGD